MEVRRTTGNVFRQLIDNVLGWLASLRLPPDPPQRRARLVPEVDPIFFHELGNQLPERCPKADEKHPRFTPFSDLQLHHLPVRWRHEGALADIRDTARRVVHLRVRRRSPDRLGGAGRGGHNGTGFVTFDPRWGVIVHTSKHVVLDPFEAANTDVIFFFDGPHDDSQPLIKSRGSARHFRSVWSMDYTSFTLELPMHEWFTWQERGTNRTFSWWNFSLTRLLYRQSRDVDVVIISHPHGCYKRVSVGKMSRRHKMSLALYDAATCPGSSGAPVIRLSNDYRHYLAVGQFVHHGFDQLDDTCSTAMGSLRPPFTLPYYRALDVTWVRRAVALLYEPVTYWALYLTDFLEVEAILFNCTDNFCYFLTLYGYFYTWNDPWTRWAFLGFLVVELFQLVLFARQGLVNVVVHVLATVHVLSMHWVTWLACVLVPREYQSLWWLVPLWVGVLLLSRYVHIERLVKRYDFFRTFLYSDV